ncbi:MAG TPA: M56 family metallopeptidase [Pyrinomonadaceae bacterium]|jgi:beta-lactamase regulating signal transducer with metallopeptidase domain
MNYFWNAVSSHSNNFDLLLFLAASAMKATFLLGFVGLLCLALRRLSAATRHLLWTLSLCAALLLPFFSIVEVLEVPVLPAQISSLKQAPSNELKRTAEDAFPLTDVRTEQSIEASPKINKSETRIPDFQPAIGSVEKPLFSKSTSDVYVVPEQRSTTSLSSLVNWTLAIWFAGVVLLLFRLLVGFMSTKWLTRSAVEFKDPKLVGLFSSLLSELQLGGRIRLLRSERTLMPIVCGVLRPVVLLPASADDWSEERRRMVLLHELTHVTRRDCLTQMLAQTACAFYWFNPFVWHAARRLRVERERACDDYVLSIGTKPSDYAHHLLEIARYLQEHTVFQWSQTTTVAMARRSQLEGRLLAILSKEGKRRAMSQMMTAGLTALMFVLFLSLAIIRPTISSAQNPQSSETALHEETSGAEKSPSGLFLTTGSESKGEAIIKSAKSQGALGPQGNNAHADDNSQQQILDGAPVDQGVKQFLKTDIGRIIESGVAENHPPQIENVPVPPAAPEPGTPTIPFIKAKYEQERKAEAQGNSDFIDEMASVGYANLSIDELVHLKSSGVTADYVRSLRALGLGNLTSKQIAGMSVNDVTPAFIEAIRNAGYRELSAHEFVSFSVHGITPEFINWLRKAGYSNLSARQLIDFAVHQVTPEFINGMREVGFGNLSPRELVTLRVHGITPAFVRDARKRLGDLTVKQIIALKIEGLIEGSGDE